MLKSDILLCYFKKYIQLDPMLSLSGTISMEIVPSLCLYILNAESVLAFGEAGKYDKNTLHE